MNKIILFLFLLLLLLLLFKEKFTNKSNVKKIAVILHVGNINIFKEIVNDYPNFFKFDLYISCNNENDYIIIKNMFPKATLFLFENKGMDIGPFLKIIKYIGYYDFYIKLHTKSDKKWRDSLIKPIYDYNYNYTSSNNIEMYGSKTQVKKGMVPTCNFKYLNDILSRNFDFNFNCNQDMYFIGGPIFEFNRVYLN